MTFREKSNCKYIAKSILKKMPEVKRPQFNFILEIFSLFLSIKGRLNFLQFARYGKRCEQSYRNGFAKAFNFLSFNQHLLENQGSKRRIIAFDPSFVRKAGKLTSGVGYYWSGVAGTTKWGLEIGGIAAVDLDVRTAYHLEAVQTPSATTDGDTLVTHYTNLLLERKERLLSISKYIVADAYFSKYNFVSSLNENGFEVISRLRNDADLLYLFTGVQKGGRGAPKKYDGKVLYNKLNDDYFFYTKIDDVNTSFHGIVYSKSLKRKINLVGVITEKKGKKTHKLYFTTGLEMRAEDVLEKYGARFQIEFLFRDAKQHTGLDHCQARDSEKLYFHWNTALTSVNIAKVAHWSNEVGADKQPFSMADVKTLYHNQLLLDRFIVKFGIRPNKPKNKKIIRDLLNYGARAA
jgi:hypothetical protein